MYLECRLFSFDLISRIGSNEVMGCCALGPKHVGLGRDHWFEMLENPRKPVAQWYTLQEHVPFCTNESTMGKCRLNCQGQSRQSTVDSSEGSLYGWQESKYWESLTGLKWWRMSLFYFRRRIPRMVGKASEFLTIRNQVYPQ